MIRKSYYLGGSTLGSSVVIKPQLGLGLRLSGFGWILDFGHHDKESVWLYKFLSSNPDCTLASLAGVNPKP